MASTKFKIPKPGEGNRERKPSVYGEGGRATGGNARTNSFKVRVTKPEKASLPPPPAASDIPIPGGHPARLKAAAKASGYAGEDNAFARLAALAGDRANVSAGGGTDGEVSTELMDEMFGGKVAEERPERDLVAERAEIVQKARRFPILRRPLRLIEAGARDAKSAGEIPPPNGGADRGVAADVAAADRGGADERAGVLRGDGAGDAGLADEQARRGEGEGDRAEARVAADQQAEADGSSERAAASGARGGDGGSGVRGSDGRGSGDVRGTALAPPSAQALAAAREIAEEVEAGLVTDYTPEQEVDVYRAMALPGVVCNACALAERCPKMQPNATCAYTEDMQGLTMRDVRNAIPRLELLADLQTERAMRGVLAERVMGGGTLDPAVSRQIEIAAAATERVARIKAANVQGASQSISVVAQGSGAIAKGGGILSKLMAGLGAPATGQGEIALTPPDPAALGSDGKVHLAQLVEPASGETEKLTVTLTSEPAQLPPRIV